MERLKSFLSENPLFLSLGLIVLIFIALLFFLRLQIASRPVRLFGKAADAGVVDPSASSIWASRYSVNIGGTADVFVFLHNAEDRAISGKSVKLNLNPAEIAGVVGEAVTDTDGKASFTIEAKAPGRLTVTAIGDGVTISRNLSLEFLK